MNEKKTVDNAKEIMAEALCRYAQEKRETVEWYARAVIDNAKNGDTAEENANIAMLQFAIAEYDKVMKVLGEEIA